MIFYTADDGGYTKLAGTQADARAVNKDFEQIDIPTDKAGLMAFVQKLYDDIYDLEQQSLDEPERGIAVPINQHTVEIIPAGADEVDLPAEDADSFNAQLLEEQVSSLGMMGVEALDRFDGWSELTGVSAAFARGVALLNVIASDDHQIARVFLRDRLKNRRRFG